MLVTDGAGRIVGCSPGMAQRVGIPADQLSMGVELAPLLALLPPGMRLRPTPLGNGMTAHIADAAPTGGGGEGAAALLAENALLRETLDSIDASVVVYDSDLRYRFGNSVYHATFPHLPPDSVLAGESYAQVLGRSIDAGSVTDPQAYSDREGFITRRIADVTDHTARAYEVRGPGPDRTFEIRAKWTPSGNRVSLRIDTTETTRLHQELLRAQRMETIAKLSGGVAHDFNNLLTVIIGNLELIQMKLPVLPPPQSAEMLTMTEAALAAADTGARLTQDLLTFARRQVTQPTSLDPAGLVLGMQDLLRRATGPGITLRIIADHGGRTIRCDPAQFEAAVMNLAMNACEAIGQARLARPGSSGEIVIRIAADAPDVLISVADTGCGMPPEVVAQAFEPFFTTRRGGNGSGLGLSQVQGFVHAAGGQVLIDSREGVGTTVTLRLPSGAAAVPADPPAAAPPAPPEPPPASAGGGTTILMVEDDADVLATTARMIAGLGYRLLLARSADEALAILEGGATVHLLFTDIVMPASTLNGVELARAATWMRPTLKVLLTTGFSANALDAEAPDAVAVLPKPYRVADLAARLRALAGTPPALASF